MGKPVRLNLGCGGKLWEDFINVDFPGNWSGQKPDVECDIRTLPFPDGCADEIHAIHVFEHFHRWEVGDILREWHRVLKPGGAIALEMPCLNKILGLFNQWYQDRTLTLHGLYGDPSYKNEHMVHKWCYGVDELKFVVEKAGFVDLRIKTPLFHFPARDMRIEAFKDGVADVRGPQADR